MMLGEMLVHGTPPPKLLKALSIVASTMHPMFDAQGFGSRTACILCSLAVRDFFWKIGMTDAQIAPVYLMMEAIDKDGVVLHSLGVGNHADAGQAPAEGNGWDGHVVVRVPKLHYLVDTTVYQTVRPVWGGLPGMIAIPYAYDLENRLFGMTPIAKLGTVDDEGTLFRMAWLDQNTNEGWRKAPDRAKDRRSDVVKAMVHKFRRAEI
jgi:hypothetical protein